MTNADVFDRAVSCHGGRLDRAKVAGSPSGHLFDAISRQAEELVTSARHYLPRLPAIHLDFVANDGVNAWAFKDAGQYFIGITSGAITLLLMLFNRMLAQSTILTNAGNPMEEAATLPPLPTLAPNEKRMRDAGLYSVAPKMEARRQYAALLHHHAVMFLIGHEIAHITHGHVDYLTARTGSPFLVEVGWNHPDQDARIERQTLEAMADRRSMYSRIDSVRLTVTGPDKVQPAWLSGPLDAGQALFDFTFAVNAVFRLFGDIRFAGSDLTAAAYPPLALRRGMAMAATLELVERRWDASLKEVTRQACGRAVVEAERAFMVITGAAESGYALQDVLSPEGRAHEKLLRDCWNGGLHDRLAPFSYEWGPGDTLSAFPDSVTT